MEINSSKKKFLPYSFVLFLLTFLLYGNSIKNKYALDDEMVTLNNERVEKGIRGIPAIFTKHHSIDSKSRYEYRPVVLLTFALEYQFFGRNPFISHFINVLLYAFTCVLIFYLLVNLFSPAQTLSEISSDSKPIRWLFTPLGGGGALYIFPLLATLFFAAHPLHTEVVNNLKSRDELLAFLFSLTALFFFMKYTERGKIYFLVAGIVLLFIAILSKKGAVIFIAIIPLLLYFFKNLSLKNFLLIGFSALIAFAGFVAFKRTMLSENSIRAFFYFENPLLFEKNLFLRIPAGLYTIWCYFEMLVFPHPLSFYYGYNQIPIAGWDNPKVWVSLLFHLAIFYYAVVNFTKKHILSFAILFYLASIFPFSNIPTPAVGIIAERFTYIASLGFCIALAYLLLKLFQKPETRNQKPETRNPPFATKNNPLFIAICALILSAYSFKTITRNPDWKDHLTLYRHDIKHLEKSAKAHALISNTIYPQLFKMPAGIQKENLIKECIFHYQKSLEIYPDYITSNNNLGSIFFTFLGDFMSASKYFQKAVLLDSGYVEAHYNLAYSLEKLGKKDSAIFFYEKTIFLKPDYKLPYDRLYPLYYTSKQFDKAIDLNLRAAGIFPDLSAVYFVNAGNIYSAKSDTLQALNYFIKAFEKEPGNKELCNHIAKVYQKIHNEEKAMEYFRKTEALQKNQP